MANLSEIVAKSKTRSFHGKHPSTAIGLDSIIPKNPDKISLSDTSLLTNQLKEELESVQNEVTKTGPDQKIEDLLKTESNVQQETTLKVEAIKIAEPDLIIEPSPKTEPDLKAESASKSKLVIHEKKLRQYELDAVDYLTRDENRLLKYLKQQLVLTESQEVQVSKSNFIKFANINQGRFHSTRQGLLEKNLITFKEVKDSMNRIGIFYKLVE